MALTYRNMCYGWKCNAYVKVFTLWNSCTNGKILINFSPSSSFKKIHLTPLHVVNIKYNYESRHKDRDDKERDEMVEMIKIEGEEEAERERELCAFGSVSL